MLGGFGVHPVRISDSGQRYRGYLTEDFRDAFSRYLFFDSSGDQSVQASLPPTDDRNRAAGGQDASRDTLDSKCPSVPFKPIQHPGTLQSVPDDKASSRPSLDETAPIKELSPIRDAWTLTGGRAEKKNLSPDDQLEMIELPL